MDRSCETFEKRAGFVVDRLGNDKLEEKIYVMKACNQFIPGSRITITITITFLLHHGVKYYSISVNQTAELKLFQSAWHSFDRQNTYERDES